MANTTENAVRRQIESMGAALFEVGVLMPARNSGETRRDAVMLLRTWDTETTRRSIPWLRARNAGGAAIYIRPHGEHHLSLVDDLTADAVQQMKSTGFEPALVVETSPGNFQAWLNHGTTLDKRTSTAAARTLAEKFGGDPGAADWRHFGRLAGFVNRKPQYQKPDGLFPFVVIAEQRPGAVYSRAESLLATVREQRNRQEQRRPLPSQPIRTSITNGLKTIDDFRKDPSYCGDGNRIDLAYAVYAFAHGATETAVRTAIETRDLSKKGSELRREEYMARTISKAIQRVGECRGR